MKDGSTPPAPSINLFRASYTNPSFILGDAGEISDASKEGSSGVPVGKIRGRNAR